MKDILYGLFSKKKVSCKEGRWKEFNKHAVLISVGNYANGQKHGRWQEYYDTGELMLEEDYQHGILHGRYAAYHLNGNVLSEGAYLDGSREGYFKIYNEGGLPAKSLLFIHDNLMEEVEITLCSSNGK